DLGVLTGLRGDLDRSRMLLHDDVVSDGQPEASALSSGFCCEEGIENLLPHLTWNAVAVVANPDLNFVAKVLCHRHYGWLIAIAAVLLFALGRRVEAVRNQVQESPCDLLGEDIDFARSGIKRPLHRNLEALFLGAGTMIGEIEALLDERVDINQPMLA